VMGLCMDGTMVAIWTRRGLPRGQTAGRTSRARPRPTRQGAAVTKSPCGPAHVLN
jgi:hypothetical protein